MFEQIQKTTSLKISTQYVESLIFRIENRSDLNRYATQLVFLYKFLFKIRGIVFCLAQKKIMESQPEWERFIEILEYIHNRKEHDIV